MDCVLVSLMMDLIVGQWVVIWMILESMDCFMVVQGYVGVGKIIQFWVVMSVISLLLEEICLCVIGLVLMYCVVGEMQSVGVDVCMMVLFFYDMQLLQCNGQIFDFSNILFLFDESLMVGLVDMVKVYFFIVVGGGWVVFSGDNDQLQFIVLGQLFRLMQQCSVVDVVIMKEIVCQVFEL